MSNVIKDFERIWENKWSPEKLKCSRGRHNFSSDEACFCFLTHASFDASRAPQDYADKKFNRFGKSRK